MEACHESSPSSPSNSERKECRPVSECYTTNKNTNDGERMKSKDFDQRRTHEVQQVTVQTDVQFSAITNDINNLSYDALQDNLWIISKKREELLQVEINLRAEATARIEISKIKEYFENKMEEYINERTQLQEQLREREQCIYNLEKIMEEREQELHKVRSDNKVTLANEVLLRKQNKEMENLRRECSLYEAEIKNTLIQMNSLRGFLHSQNGQIRELGEMHRRAHEIILYKEEQLKKADACIHDVQEMNAIHLAANCALEAKMKDQLHNFWMWHQREFEDMKKYHFQSIEKLQLELADAGDKNRVLPNELRTFYKPSDDLTSFLQSKGEHSGFDENNTTKMILALLNEGKENYQNMANASEESRGEQSSFDENYTTKMILAMLDEGEENYQNMPNASEKRKGEQSSFDENHTTKMILAMLDEGEDNYQNMANASEEESAKEQSDGEDPSSFIASSSHLEDSNNPYKDNFDTIFPEIYSSMMIHKKVESGNNPSLLDENSLLACIVRVVPVEPRAQIRISTTLTNRLAKMISPFRWSNYKKQYGKLNAFLSSHPELFVIEGDFVHLREGAQEIISALTTEEKVAAEVSSPRSLLISPIVVTPKAKLDGEKNPSTRSMVLPTAVIPRLLPP